MCCVLVGDCDDDVSFIQLPFVPGDKCQVSQTTVAYSVCDCACVCVL